MELVNKYQPRTEATIKGHIRQQYKGKQSTRIQQEVPIMTQQSSPEILTDQTHQTFLKVTECSRKIYTDQTGRFPITSSRGYKYIMIAYDYDSNNILAEPIKSRTSLHTKDAYQKMRKLLCSRGLTTRKHVLDNKCSKVLKEYMRRRMKHLSWYHHTYTDRRQQIDRYRHPPSICGAVYFPKPLSH